MINRLKRFLGPLGYRGLDKDFERKQAEEALQVSEERYSSIVANAMQGRIFHKPASELVGRYCFEEFEKRETVCSHCPGVQAMATGCSAMVDTKGIRDDGSVTFSRIQAFPVFNAEGTPTSFIEVVEDITEHKQAEGEIQSLIAQLHDTAQVLRTSAAEILAAATQQASGATEQSAATTQTATTVDELKSIAEQSVMRAQEVAGASQRTVEVSRTGRQAVDETMEIGRASCRERV